MDLKVHPVLNTPVVGRDTSHSTRLLKALSSVFLKTARVGISTASLGNLFQCFTTLRVKNFFLISNLNSPPFQFLPITSCPITTAPDEKSFSSFPVGPPNILEGCCEVSTQPFLQAEQPLISTVEQHFTHLIRNNTSYQGQ